MSAISEPISSDGLVAAIIDNGPVNGQQLLVVGLCMLLNMLDEFDITAMAIVASAVSTELQLTPDKVGWIFSFALAGMMGGAMFLAPVADLIGRRKMIIASVVLVGVSILLTAQADSLAEFIVLRFISGIGAGAMLASQAALAAEYSPEKYRALSVLVVTAGYPLGAMFTSVIAGYLMEDYGWRGMFLAGGSATLAMVVIAFMLIPESLKFLFERRPDNALGKVNRVLVKLRRPTLDEMPIVDSNAAKSKLGFVETLLAMLAPELRKVTLTLWLNFFLCYSTLYFLMSWIPKLMVDAGHSELVGRDAFFLFNLGGVIGIFIVGILSTRFKLTNVVSCLLLAAAAGMLVFALAPNQKGVLLGLIFAVGLVLQGGFTGLYGAAAKAYPTEVRTTGIGWAIGLGRAGAVVGPAAAGYLILFGFGMSANFLIFAVPMALGGLVAYTLHIR